MFVAVVVGGFQVFVVLFFLILQVVELVVFFFFVISSLECINNVDIPKIVVVLF